MSARKHVGLKIGDVVRIICNYSRFMDSIGVVVQEPCRGPYYDIMLSDGQIRCYTPSELELV